MMILGHRGAKVLAPENTVGALTGAIECGAAGSEFDVRLTTDGVCVCTHDALATAGGRERRVCDLTLEEIRQIPVAGPGGLVGVIPTLAEALVALSGSVIMAEVKNHPWDPCYDARHGIALATAEALPAGSILACFDPGALAAVRERYSHVRTAVLTSAVFDPDANLHAALEGGHEICSVEHPAITAEFVERAHEHGLEVYAWATHEPDEVRRLAAAGVDALMCDDPGSALASLRG